MDPVQLNAAAGPAAGTIVPPRDGRVSKTTIPAPAGADGLDLSPEAQRQVAELKDTDRKVRAHEAAHQSAGAGLVRGGASYTYRRGPDGQLYAVGGEVTLDTSPVPDNPRATAAKLRQVQAAALAPADPSAQDRAVAAQAAAGVARAEAEAAKAAPIPGARMDMKA